MIEDADGTSVPVDFFIRLFDDCDPGDDAPIFSRNTPCGDVIPVGPGIPVSFPIGAFDPNQGDTVNLQVNGMPGGASHTTTLPVDGNPVSTGFQWTPAASQIGQHVLTYTATEDCGAQTMCVVTIDVNVEECGNGIDDDGDGLADCDDDPDCAHDPICSPCGDGIVGPHEQCDDGNLNDGDCCSSICEFETAGSVCASDQMLCTVDICDGQGTCTHEPGNAGTECRASEGICDVAEACDGQTATCPADERVDAGVECRGAEGLCDVAETCDGVAADCPIDARADAGTECRASAGVCDVAETCDGQSAECPADSRVDAGVECRAGGGICDLAETCDGQTVDCPFDDRVDAGVECRPSAGVCDVAEACDGQAAECPSDVVADASTVCRESAGICDVDDTCDGQAVTCPADVFVDAGTECRASSGECDQAEQCTGSAADCLVDGFAAAGQACTDDGNPCTTDACDGGGGCAHPAGNAGTLCRDVEGVCDVAETCDGVSEQCPADGVAASGTTCRAVAGTCDVVETCDGQTTACPADGFVASGTECRASLGECDVAETCDGAAAVCPADQTVTDGTLCTDDGLYCTGGEVCTAGACVSSGDPCRGTDCNGCQEASDTCFDAVNTPCTDDADECTEDFCDGSGNCTHPPIALAPACNWIMVAGVPGTAGKARTRAETRINGDVCGNTGDVGGAESENRSWVMLGSSGKVLKVRPRAGCNPSSDFAIAGGEVRGVQGALVCSSADSAGTCLTRVPAPDVTPVYDQVCNPDCVPGSGVVDASGTHPKLAECADTQAQVAGAAVFLDSLPATAPPRAQLCDRNIDATYPECTVQATGNLTIIDIEKLKIPNGGKLILDGGGNSEATFILRAQKQLIIGRGATVELTGGAKAEHVLFYGRMSGKCLVSKGLLGQRTVGAGVIFCPQGKVFLKENVTWDGAVIGKKQAELGEQVILNHIPFFGL